jgi:hypothetical protein
MKGRANIGFSLFLILVGSFVIYYAWHWPFKARFFPLVLAVPLMILALTHLFLELFGAPEKAGGPAVEAEFSNDVPPAVARRRVITVFSWIAGFILTVYLVGFPVAVPLFVFSYLKIESGVGWARSVALTALTWGFFYGLFQRLLSLQFEAGIVQTWMGI